ncbi:MAG: hypothetical protein H7263_09150 [Candidatus Sericytochromatia bacterium]|nr:hypothetical protein [Candidatus Sericytochromatia bacterium]
MIEKLNKKSDLKLGQSVRVKEGIICPDDENMFLSGYEGRIVDFDETENKELLVCIEWDSITLRILPENYILDSLQDGLDYELMNLSLDEVELTVARDSEVDVNKAQDEIHEKYMWSELGEEGKIIKSVINDLDSEIDVFEAWKRYIEKNITFPFEVEIVELSEKGKLRIDDVLSLDGIDFVDENYGIVVNAKKNRNKYSVPLCDLEVTDKKSSNYIHLRAYVVWFANQ